MSMQPNLKIYSDEEQFAIVQEYLALLDEGKEQEASITALKIPLIPLDAQLQKDEIGIEALIATGQNLSKAVEKYGMEWLEE